MSKICKNIIRGAAIAVLLAVIGALSLIFACEPQRIKVRAPGVFDWLVYGQTVQRIADAGKNGTRGTVKIHLTEPELNAFCRGLNRLAADENGYSELSVSFDEGMFRVKMIGKTEKWLPHNGEIMISAAGKIEKNGEEFQVEIQSCELGYMPLPSVIVKKYLEHMIRNSPEWETYAAAVKYLKFSPDGAEISAAPELLLEWLEI